jgi:hypothetical protein
MPERPPLERWKDRTVRYIDEFVCYIDEFARLCDYALDLERRLAESEDHCYDVESGEVYLRLESENERLRQELATERALKQQVVDLQKHLVKKLEQQLADAKAREDAAFDAGVEAAALVADDITEKQRKMAESQIGGSGKPWSTAAVACEATAKCIRALERQQTSEGRII